MNSQTTSILITSTTILAFAFLLANVSVVGSVFATGTLDDEEEEAAIEALQNSVEEIKDTLGTIELNLTEGTNHIDANCPTTEEIVQEVVANITNEEEQPTCPLAPAVPVQENVTEVIEEIIENVTAAPVEEEPTCPFAPPKEETIIPGIVLPNVSEPVEPECPLPPPVTPEPTQQPECPQPPVAPTNTTDTVTATTSNLTDGQQVASIEFDASCSCFIVDKTPVVEETQ